MSHATYSVNASEALGNKIAHQSDLLYFAQMWGGDSETCSAAAELADILRSPSSNLGRIKHAYVKPGMFGWCSEGEGGDKLEWISYRGFITHVVKKEAGDALSRGTCVELYKAIVAYLTREGGVSRNLFDKKYSDYASFSLTFERLCENAHPDFWRLAKDIVQIKRELTNMQDDWQRLLYQDLTKQVAENELLLDPAKYFDKDQCDSLAKLNPVLFPGTLRIDHSVLGEDLKREIRKKLNLSME